MGLHLVHTLLPVFTGSSRRAFARSYLWEGHPPWHQILVWLSKIFLISCLKSGSCRLRRLPDLCRNLELVLVPCRRRCCLDRSRRLLQRFLQRFQLPFLAIRHPSPRPSWTHCPSLELQPIVFRIRNPPCPQLLPPPEGFFVRRDLQDNPGEITSNCDFLSANS